MKNYILIITLIISACNCKKINNSNPNKLSTSVSVIDDKAFKAKNLKEFGNDTMKFIQNLEKNKAHYINKPLSILLNDLDMPVKGYLPGTVYENLNISPS